jgi:Ceramidase
VVSQPASCLPSLCFCEAIRASPVAQPVNTLTSLAFVVAAAIVLDMRRWTTRQDAPDNLMSSTRVYPRLYALALLAIGVGSAWFHASLTFAGQTADVAGMYLLATFIVLYNWGRVKPMGAPLIATLYVALNFALIALLITHPAYRRYAFAALIACGLALELRVRATTVLRAESRLLVAALAAIAVGFAFWSLDITHRLCRPESIFQGHGVWHICGAISALLLARYYASEAMPGCSR